jgi:hypothetical protein
LTTLEEGGSGGDSNSLIVENIKTINLHLWIDGFYNLDTNEIYRIPAEGSEDKIFQYFKRFDPNNNLIQSEVLVQTKHDL